jgi:putative component of membrane protein insertase Oxa1/YidC/SpoIIIJ protein YidD
MRFVLITIIKLYWKFIPESSRKSCLFAESCSRYVYRITKDKGFWAGLKALKSRYKKCRPGYQIICNSQDENIELHLVDGTILKDAEISIHLKQYK